ncbi:MAG: hypothetical protein Q8O67_34095 [Deltaproteobacteria bacterium]|nr:hypothetical protein [Deltaproteobacteria bacterium]
MLACLWSGCLFFVPAPVFEEVPDQVAEVGQRLDIDLASFASDPENRPLVFSVTAGVGAIEDESVYVLTPAAADIGPNDVEVAATNGLREDRAAFVVTVNAAP